MNIALIKVARKILDRAAEAYAAYPATQFEKASGCPFHSVSNGKIPSSPGERAYTHILSQDFEKGVLNRQDATLMALTNRTSVTAGLNTLFPEWAIKEALENALTQFTMDEGVREFDHPHLMPAIMPASFCNKSHEESSPMHIDRDFHRAEYSQDKSPDTSNVNLNNRQLIDGYEFMRNYPEYGLAMKWIAGTVTDLGKAIERELETNPQYTSLKNSGLHETLELIAHPQAQALMDGRLPVAVSSLLASCKGSTHRDPDPNDIEAAINNIRHFNVLKRPRTSPSGESFTGVCPASRFNLMCLKTEMRGAPALAQFVHKLRSVSQGIDPETSEQATIDVLTKQQNFAQMISAILSTPEAIEARSEVQLRDSLSCITKIGLRGTHP